MTRTTADDIHDGESIDITVRIDEVDCWQGHDTIAAKIKCRDLEGESLTLTIFDNNAAANWDWVVGDWYRLANAEGDIYKGDRGIIPDWNFDRERLDTVPDAADDIATVDRIEELWRIDRRREQAVASYLDEHLYPSIASTTERREDRSDQFDGIDLIADIDGVGEELLIDEKAQADYANDPRPTFILELGFLNKRGELRPGWFYDDDKQTEYYLFVWLPRLVSFEFSDSRGYDWVDVEFPDGIGIDVLSALEDTDGIENLDASGMWMQRREDVLDSVESVLGSIDDWIRNGRVTSGQPLFTAANIQAARCLLVARDDIQSFLSREGYDKDHFETKAKELRQNGSYGSAASDHGDFKYYFTKGKDEEPINIVMYYQRLHELAAATYTVTPSSLSRGEKLF
jgi:hypothetical protein